MSEPLADDRVAAREPASPSHCAHAPGRRTALVARAIQVRLRFVVVLIVAFLVVGMWGPLINYWDTLTHRFTRSHASEHAVSADTEYFCPMDPGVVSDWPAICPVCNMDLVRRKKGEAVILPEGVVARMQFSPYRIQLAGIKTSVIGRQRVAREFVIAGRLVESAVGPATENAGTSSPSTGRPLALILEAEAYLRDLIFLTPGREGQISFDDLPGAPTCAGTIVAAEPGDAAAQGGQATRVRIRLESPPAIARKGMFCTARFSVPLSEMEAYASSIPAAANAADGFVAVPETAVVDTGNRQVVFVETMPGMFDGVEVKLGPRCGDFFPVVAGLEPGQKVATAGAFLIDAEARLSPNLAAGYFGASRAADPNSAAGPSAESAITKKITKTKSKVPAAAALSAEDRALVAKQKTCPVTGLELDSMGGPIAVTVENRRVFICCKGCESKLKQDPKKYLTRLETK